MQAKLLIYLMLALTLAGWVEGKNVCKKKKKEFDYIIVGNGTAGAVLARKLSDNFKNSVLVLEAGENFSKDPEVLDPNPFASTQVLNDLTVNPKFAKTYSLPLFVPLQFTTYSQGRMWGGSSAHNYLLAIRGTPGIYDFWSTFSGNPVWSYNNLLSDMKAIETYTPDGTTPDLQQRGTSGPLFITQTPPVFQDPLAQAIAQATNSPLISDYNDPNEGNIGVSANQNYVTPPPNSIRSFSINAFLPSSVVSAKGKGKNGRQLRIRSDAQVTQVLFKKRRAIAVEYIHSKNQEKVLRVYAKKKIILCAGSVSSPALLQRSGIGDAKLLKSLDIPVIVDNPNVGANLQNQYGVQGIIAGSSPLPIMAFIDESPFMPADGARRFQIIAQNAGAVTLLFGFLTVPNSRGSLHIVSKNPFIDPVIDLNMFSDGPVTTPGTDAYLIVSFFKILKNIAAAFGSQVLSPPAFDYPPPFGPAPNDDRLLADAQSQPFLVPEDHIIGTTRMATSINEGVVDGTLHVFGVKNLMVADLGVAPLNPDGNIAFAGYIIGLEAAKFLGAE
jgi:choline dehydrogenase